MSSYDTATYRDNAFQRLARHTGIKGQGAQVVVKALDWNVEEFGNFPVQAGLTPGNLAAQVRAGTVKLEDIYDGAPIKVNQQLVDLLSADKPFYVGLQAVYKTFSKLWLRQKEADSSEDDKFVLDMFYTGLVLGQHTPKDAAEKSRRYLGLWQRHGAGMRNLAKDLVRLAGSGNIKRYRMAIKDSQVLRGPYPTVDTAEARRLFRGDVVLCQGLVIWWDNQRFYILTREDIDRLDKMMSGLSNALFYFHTYGQMTPENRTKLLSAVHRYVEDMVDRMSRISHADAQWLCRGYDVAYYIALARYSSDIDTVSLKQQVGKARKPEIASFFDCIEVSRIVENLPIKEGLEILLVYKILPPGDFDYFGAAHRQASEYAKQHVIENRAVFDQVMRHHKKLMIKAYHARHGVCPGNLPNPDPDVNWEIRYPAIDPDMIDVNRVNDIVLTGQFSYADHTMDVFDMVKDKAICPLDVRTINRESELRAKPRKEKNQLLDVMSRPGPISMLNLRENLHQLEWDIKTEDKAEAKKPHGRWFMECHTDVRLVMSEYEASIAAYGKYLEGYVLGKGIREKQRTMNHVTEALDTENEIVQTFWSLDIDKWSPHMPIEVQRALNEQWADAFGHNHINQLDQLYTQGNLHYIKRRVHHILPKTGNDYEGISGKKLTMYHLAVMHAAAAEMRRKELIHGNARFAVLVDDGVLRLYVKRDQIADNVAQIREFIGGFWKDAGIEISWDKTLVSTEFAIFLNEIRYANRAVSTGVRAIVKMTNFVEGAAPSIVQDLAKVESTARGAIFAGSTLTPVYWLYSFLVIDTVRKWAGKDHKLKDGTVLWLFAPIALGGGGVCNALTLLGSLDYDSFQSGMANLFLSAHRFPLLTQSVNRILNQEMRPITDQAMASNPTSIRRHDAIFRIDRLRVALEKALTYYLTAPTMTAYNIVDGVQLSQLVSVSVARETDMPIELRNLYNASSMESMVDRITTKVLKSGTAIAMLPRRAIYRATISNITEARKVIQLWN